MSSTALFHLGEFSQHPPSPPYLPQPGEASTHRDGPQPQPHCSGGGRNRKADLGVPASWKPAEETFDQLLPPPPPPTPARGHLLCFVPTTPCPVGEGKAFCKLRFQRSRRGWRLGEG